MFTKLWNVARKIKVGGNAKHIFWFVFPLLAGSVLMFCLEYFWLSEYSIGSANLGAVVFCFQVIYTLESLVSVKEDEHGALFFWGIPLKKLSSGPFLVPWGILRVRKVTKLVQEREYPAEPKDVWKGKQEDMPSGKVPPIRVTLNMKDKSPDPLDARITAEICLFLRYCVIDSIKYFTTIGSLEKAAEHIEDVMISTASALLVKKTPAEALKEWPETNEEIKKQVDLLVADWGIDASTAAIKEIDLSHTVNRALLGLPAEKLIAQATGVKAEAEKTKRTLEGEGAGSAITSELTGRARGLKKLTQVIKSPEGATAFAGEVSKEIAANSEFSIFGGNGFGEVAQIVKIVSDSLNRKGGTK